MQGKQNILVAFDGSQQAMDTVFYVSRFFSPDRAVVTLFHVAAKIPEAFLDLQKDENFSPSLSSLKVWEKKSRKAIDEAFDAAKNVFLEAGFPEETVTITYHPMEKGVARDILTESAKNYHALALGRSGVSRLENIPVGSVAGKIINTANYLPLVIVDGLPLTDKILIGFDGSKGAAKAVNCVCEHMVEKLREVMLCQVVRSLNTFPGVNPVFDEEEEKTWLKETGAFLEPEIAHAENQLIDAGFHPGCIYQQVMENKTSRAGGIVEAAKNGKFGTIVMGRRGISDVKEFPIGRVSRKVILMENKMAVWLV